MTDLDFALLPVLESFDFDLADEPDPPGPPDWPAWEPCALRPETVWTPCGVGPEPTLTRTAEGLLFHDDFTAMPDGQVIGYKEPHDFDVGGVASRHYHGDDRPFSEVWEVRDGALQLNLLEAHGHYWLMRMGVPAVTGMVVQAVAEFDPGAAANVAGQEIGVLAAASEGFFGDTPGLNAVWAEAIRSDGYLVKFANLATEDGGGGLWFVNAVEGATDPSVELKVAIGAPSQPDPPGYFSDDTIMRVWIAGDHAECKAADAWPGGRPVPPVLLPAGVAGVHLRKNGGVGEPYPARWFSLAAYRSNTIRCTGLEPGMAIRAGGLERVAVGTVASLDLNGLHCPLPAVEVLDEPGGDVLARLAPEGGVWGGDTYLFRGG